jgi:hypothetical protein
LVWVFEEAAVGRVSVPVVGVVAPAVADEDELASKWWGVEVVGFGDRGLENQGARWKEFTDGGGISLTFTLGLACILEAELVHVGGGE